MDLPTSFRARFRTHLAGMEFNAEAEFDDINAFARRVRENDASDHDMVLVASEIAFDLTSGTGCRKLDDESEKIFVNVLKALKVGAQHFYNERMGTYDPLNNVVTPADFGLMLPDGSLRVVWFLDEAASDFDTVYEIAKGTLQMLLELQDMVWGKATEAEYEDSIYDALEDRRIDVLFEAGLWPDTDNAFDAVSPSEQTAILEKYRLRNPLDAAVAA